MQFVYSMFTQRFKYVSVIAETGKILISCNVSLENVPHSEHGIYYMYNKNADKIMSFVDRNPGATIILPAGPAIIKSEIIKYFKKIQRA